VACCCGPSSAICKRLSDSNDRGDADIIHHGGVLWSRLPRKSWKAIATKMNRNKMCLNKRLDCMLASRQIRDWPLKGAIPYLGMECPKPHG
jgi:hypothetical protein